MIRKRYFLLEIACGKAQDLYKWKHNSIQKVVGIDLIKDNIENPHNGAYSRYINMNENDKWSDDIHFLVGDCKRNIQSLDAFESEHYVKQAETLFMNQFDLISIQFAIHYFFESKETIDNIVENIDSNLKTNGYLIGSCFDGKKIFDLFNKQNTSELNSGDLNLWKIEKLYETYGYFRR